MLVPVQVHERYAGRLILLDGATGKSLGRFLNMPQGRETYMSPVLHTMKDGSQYILFGSGGETVPGIKLTYHPATDILLRILSNPVWIFSLTVMIFGD